MKRFKTLALVLPLLFVGCILTTGQITIDVPLDAPITIDSGTPFHEEDVDLNTIDSYNDHKDDLDGLADLAVLGTVTNTGGPDATVTVYITADETSYTTVNQITTNALLLWGPFDVPAGETVTIDWDDSAKLFAPDGKGTVLNEIKGDGMFTIYVVGGSGNDFVVDPATLVLVVDAGI
ncbi:MAG: hypothetical protein ACREOU_02620 [Candidatus Eiseniibacteriota bacterium]